MIFKLSYKITLNNLFTKKYINIDEAFYIYNGHCGYSDKYYLDKSLPFGFFRINLNFSEWLDHYNIGIL
jgi:hypothetical protein